MKILLMAASAGLCIYCLLSCNNNADTKSTSSSSTDSSVARNQKIAEDMYDGVQTGDTTKFRGMAEDAVDHEGNHTGVDLKGKDSIVHHLLDLHNHFKDIKIDITTEAANQDYVFQLATFNGTTTDNSQGVPVGTKITYKGVDVTRFKNGKATEHWGFLDPNDMMKMMGGQSESKTKNK